LEWLTWYGRQDKLTDASLKRLWAWKMKNSVVQNIMIQYFFLTFCTKLFSNLRVEVKMKKATGLKHFNYTCFTSFFILYEKRQAVIKSSPFYLVCTSQAMFEGWKTLFIIHIFGILKIYFLFLFISGMQAFPMCWVLIYICLWKPLNFHLGNTFQG